MALTDSNIAHGKDTALWLNAYDIAGFSNSVGSDIVVDEAEAAVFGTYKHYKAGQKSQKLTIKGVYDKGTDGLRYVSQTAFGSELQRIIYAPKGSTAGYPAYAGRGAVQSHTPNAVTNDVVSVETDVRMTGQFLVEGEILYAGTITQTTTGSTIDATAARIGALGYVGVLSVTALTATDTLDVKVQHSANGTDWSDLFSFTQAAAATSEYKFAATGAVYRYRRVVATLTENSGNGSATFVVAFGEM